MISVNAPVPPAVRERAADRRARLVAGGAEPRDRFTLVVKRLGEHDPGLTKRVRRALSGTAPFAARVDRVAAFAEPPTGPAPVVHFPVESPGIETCHRRLCEVVDPAPGIEAEAYRPHVTIGRGGGADLAGEAVEPVEWTVEELLLYDARREERAGRVPLG